MIVVWEIILRRTIGLTLVLLMISFLCLRIGNQTIKRTTYDETKVTWTSEGDVLACECVNLMLEVDDLGFEENIGRIVCDETEVLKDKIHKKIIKKFKSQNKTLLNKL